MLPIRKWPGRMPGPQHGTPLSRRRFSLVCQNTNRVRLPQTTLVHLIAAIAAASKRPQRSISRVALTASSMSQPASSRTQQAHKTRGGAWPNGLGSTVKRRKAERISNTRKNYWLQVILDEFLTHGCGQEKFVSLHS